MRQIAAEALADGHRGGQTYYVVPCIADLDDIAEFLREAVPELRVARAHGQLGATGASRTLATAFYEGEYDVLLSTAIVESASMCRTPTR
ncbi:MAG: helicase-related protein [Burkholderiaceae bacterium]